MRLAESYMHAETVQSSFAEQGIAPEMEIAVLRDMVDRPLSDLKFRER